MKHRHPASSYAVVGAAALVTLAGGKVSMCAIAVGGVMANPVRASTAEKALTGQTATDEHIAAAAGKVADAISEPFGDLYASGEYRTHLATVLVKRALLKAVERAKG
jgi:carbon-monoxide dehydrogenase medium subunit